MTEKEEEIFIEGFEAAVKIVQRAHDRNKCEEPDCDLCALIGQFGCDCPACTGDFSSSMN